MNLKLLKIARFFHLINKKNYNEKRQIEIVKKSPLFDAKWYLAQNPDVKSKKIGAAKHYVKYGWKEGRNPSPDFDTEEYLHEYPELKVKNWCPLFHHMLEHKELMPKIDYKEQIFNLLDKYTNRYKGKSTDYKLIAKSKYFNKRWYLKIYPDVKKAKMDPIQHYMKYGWKEGRNPSERFCGNDYLELYEDVKKSGINPLLHYLKFGIKENRKSVIDFNKSSYICALLKRAQYIKRSRKYHNGEKIKLKVCYISYTNREIDIIKDASVRYRCYNPIEALHDSIAISAVCTLNRFIKYPSYDYDIYVFHRPTLKEKRCKTVINRLKKLHKILIADYDDLIFGDEQTVATSTIKLCEGPTPQETLKNFRNFTNAMKLFNNFSTSTPALKVAILRQLPEANVQVIHNFVPDRLFNTAKEIGWYSCQKDENVLMYCSGGTSHNNDFKLVKDAILKCLKDDKKLRLRILGTLSVPDELKNNPQCELLDKVEYLEMFDKMKDAAFMIAPLCDTFNNLCKSNIKFLESSLTGSILITSDCSLTARDKSTKTIIGIAKTPEDWKNIIEKRHLLLKKGYIDKNLQYITKKYSKDRFLSEFSLLIKNYKED